MVRNSKKVLSIIIPVYNSSKSVEKCILSIKHQYIDKSKVEIIAIDDGSSDNSLEKLHKFKDIKVFHQENKGVGATRNFGLEQATGRYVWFVDADDEICPSSVSEKWIDELETSDIDVFLFGVEGRRNTSCINIVNRCSELIDRGTFSKRLFNIFSENILNPLWNKVYLRRTITDNNIIFNDHKAGEDACFNYQVLSVAKSLKVDTDIRYRYYFDSATSVKHKYYSNHMEDEIERLRLMEIMFDRVGIPQRNVLYENEVVDILFGEENNLFNQFNGDISFKNYRRLIKSNAQFEELRSSISLCKNTKKFLIVRSTLLSFIFIKIRETWLTKLFLIK